MEEQTTRSSVLAGVARLLRVVAVRPVLKVAAGATAVGVASIAVAALVRALLPGSSATADPGALAPAPPLPTMTPIPTITPISDPTRLPPPPYNRFIRPDTGRLETTLWDDRALSAAQKAAQPWYDPRWKPFSHCMADEGYDVRTDLTKPFAQEDLDEIVARANAQLPDGEANKRIGSNTDTIPGIAGAFLRCAGRWLALTPAEWPGNGIQRLEPGQIPTP
jgi:hypothetical protein